MTDNEIIKALECCNKSDNGKGCFECPYRQYCPDCLRRRNEDTIDLINRQQAEKEVMQKYIDCLKSENHDYNHATEQLAKENRQLQAEIERLETNLKEAFAEIEKLKRINLHCESETVKEFAERLKEKATPHYFDNTHFAVKVEEIDNLLKERVGES